MSFYNTGNPVPSIDPRDLDDNAKHIDELANSTFPTFVDRMGVTRRTLAGIEADADAIVLRDELADSTDPSKGAGMVGFLPAGAGAVGRPVLSKLRESVSVEDHGATGDGVTNDTAKIQSVIDATPAGVPVIFDLSKTYSVDSLTLKPGGIYKTSALFAPGHDHTQINPCIKYRGTTGNVFNLGTPGASPVRGVALLGLAVDGNGTTGAICSWAAFRGTIQGCVFHDAKDIILFQNTTSWAGENLVISNQFYNFTDAIRSIGIYAIDGFLEDNRIFSGVRGIVLAEMAGWNITLNHTYGISGAHMDLTGSLCMVHHNYCDNIQSVGILLTISTAVSGTQITSNNITGVTTSNVIAIHAIANATGKANIINNTVWFVTALTGTTGIKTSGPATFFGSVLNNQVEQADTPYDLHSAPTTDFVEARSNRLLINGTEMRFGHNGNATWQNSLMSVTLAPSGLFAANAGSLALRTSGGASGSGELYLKASGSGNTGWTQVVTAIKGSATVDIPSIAPAGTHAFNVTVTGATLGNSAKAACGNATAAGLMWSEQVLSADTVTITLFNPTGSAIDPTSQTINVTVFK